MTESPFNVLSLSGWYPGHMLKAGRAMQEVLRLVDLVIEVVDARAPASSRNPRFREMLQSRPAVLLLNKADLADARVSRRWQAHFEAAGERVFLVEAQGLGDPARLLASWRQLAEAARTERGVRLARTRPLRVMIAGVPNVGKSTLINAMSAGRRVQVGPKPGVTRQNQWVPLREDMELLDTPGVLWPKIADKEHELRLALAGCIRDEVIGIELLAEFLWVTLSRRPEASAAWSRYGLEAPPTTYPDFIAAVARRRGLLQAGGRIDHERSATAALKDFREGRLGRISLEVPPETGAAGVPEKADA